MKKLAAISAVLLVLAVPVAQAGLVTLNFAGQIVANITDDGTVYDSLFSGFFVIDTDVMDNRPQPGSAHFPQAIVGGSVIWDAVAYDLTLPGIFNDIFIVDNDSVVGDAMNVSATFVNAAGEDWIFALNLSDTSGTVFSSDLFPSDLDLADFDAFDINSGNPTAAQFLSFSPSMGVTGPLTFLELVQPVPTPTTAWLLLVAMIAWRMSGSSFAGRPNR